MTYANAAFTTKTVPHTLRSRLPQDPKHHFFSMSITVATHKSLVGSTRRSTGVSSQF